MEDTKDKTQESELLRLPNEILVGNVLSHLTYQESTFFGQTCREAKILAIDRLQKDFSSTSFDAIRLFQIAHNNGVILNIPLLSRLCHVRKSADFFYTLQRENNPSWGIAAICGDMAWLKKKYADEYIYGNQRILYFLTVGGHLDLVTQNFRELLLRTLLKINYTAGRIGHFHICDYLENEFNVKPNQKFGDFSETTLDFYAEHGKKSRLEIALEKYSKEVEGTYLVHRAAKSGHINTVDFLADKFPNEFKEPHPDTKETCAHVAAENGHPALLKRLILHHGLDPCAQNCAGMTPLHLSTTTGHWECFWLLLPYYANHPKRAEILACAPHYAAGKNKMDFFDKYILLFGAKYNCIQAKDSCGAPLSHHLLTSKNVLTAKKLVYHHGMDLRATNSKEENALLMIAKIAEKHDIDTLWRFVSALLEEFNPKFNNKLHLMPDIENVTLQDFVIRSGKEYLFSTLSFPSDNSCKN